MTDLEGYLMIDAKLKRVMLKLARDTITHVEDHAALDELRKRPIVKMESGVFVSVYVQDDLRGCIGNLDSRDVHESIIRNALYAAYHDSRFPPIRPDEYSSMKVHVNILTKPSPLIYKNADDLVGKIKNKGITIHRGNHEATFLPSVWEQLPVPEEFLGHLCMKAGLPPGDWKQPGLSVEYYESEEFSE